MKPLPPPDPPRCPLHPDHNSKVIKTSVVSRSGGETVRKRLCRCKIPGCGKTMKQTFRVGLQP